MKTHPPCPSSGALRTVTQQRYGWLLTWISLQPANLDPHTRECRAFSACVRVAVSVFICMSLFKKQPSSWGSWTLHVRVSPKPCARHPSPQGPASSHYPLVSLHCCSLQEKVYGKLQDSSFSSPVPACWGCLHTFPSAQGYLISTFLSLF